MVAVLDTGYLPHGDLAANLLPGYDFVSADDPAQYGGNAYWTANDGDGPDPDATDPGDWATDADVSAGYCDEASRSSRHGTAVAGLIAAVGNNALGSVGIAYGARSRQCASWGGAVGFVRRDGGRTLGRGLSVPSVASNTRPAKILNLSLGAANISCDTTAQGIVDEIKAKTSASWSQLVMTALRPCFSGKLQKG